MDAKGSATGLPHRVRRARLLTEALANAANIRNRIPAAREYTTELTMEIVDGTSPEEVLTIVMDYMYSTSVFEVCNIRAAGHNQSFPHEAKVQKILRGEPGSSPNK